jgi:hypothetical protein
MDTQERTVCQMHPRQNHDFNAWLQSIKRFCILGVNFDPGFRRTFISLVRALAALREAGSYDTNRVHNQFHSFPLSAQGGFVHILGGLKQDL